ncbi:MAG: hypothetical protein IJ775_01365 [Muribaculaceae bacterium]|nr:hypothetical protein [Muribaculaceae bacterium]
MRHVIATSVFIALLLYSCQADKTHSAAQTQITAEMAYTGVNNYCHRNYDWSPAEANPDIMRVEMDGESATEYRVVFRSYTGALVYFHVDKSSGTTRMVDHVPSLGVEEEAGTINLLDYLENSDH